MVAARSRGRGRDPGPMSSGVAPGVVACVRCPATLAGESLLRCRECGAHAHPDCLFVLAGHSTPECRSHRFEPFGLATSTWPVGAPPRVPRLRPSDLAPGEDAATQLAGGEIDFAPGVVEFPVAWRGDPAGLGLLDLLQLVGLATAGIAAVHPGVQFLAPGLLALVLASTVPEPAGENFVRIERNPFRVLHLCRRGSEVERLSERALWQLGGIQVRDSTLGREHGRRVRFLVAGGDGGGLPASPDPLPPGSAECRARALSWFLGAPLASGPRTEAYSSVAGPLAQVRRTPSGRVLDLELLLVARRPISGRFTVEARLRGLDGRWIPSLLPERCGRDGEILATGHAEPEAPGTDRETRIRVSIPIEAIPIGPGDGPRELRPTLSIRDAAGLLGEENWLVPFLPEPDEIVADLHARLEGRRRALAEASAGPGIVEDPGEDPGVVFLGASGPGAPEPAAMPAEDLREVADAPRSAPGAGFGYLPVPEATLPVPLEARPHALVLPAGASRLSLAARQRIGYRAEDTLEVETPTEAWIASRAEKSSWVGGLCLAALMLPLPMGATTGSVLALVGILCLAFAALARASVDEFLWLDDSTEQVCLVSSTLVFERVRPLVRYAQVERIEVPWHDATHRPVQLCVRGSPPLPVQDLSAIPATARELGSRLAERLGTRVDDRPSGDAAWDPVTIEDVRVILARLRGRRGLEIRVPLRTAGMVGRSVTVEVRVRGLDGWPVLGMLASYRAEDGSARVRRRTPQVETQREAFPDLWLFLPTRAMAIPPDTGIFRGMVEATASLPGVRDDRRRARFGFFVIPEDLEREGPGLSHEPRIEATAGPATGAAACPVCAEAVGPEAWACPACLTPHHPECHEYLGGCATYGCAGSPPIRARR